MSSNQNAERLKNRLTGIISSVSRSENSSLGHSSVNEAIESVLSLINQEIKVFSQAVEKSVIGEEYKHGDVLDGVPLPKVHRDLLKHEHAKQNAALRQLTATWVEESEME